MKRELVLMACCALLVLLFVYTATSKLIDFKGFTTDVNKQPFPNVLTPYLSVFIVTSETGAALLMLFSKTRRAGLFISFALMAAFTIYTGLVLLHVFAYVPCSCGGVIKHLTWGQHLVFNLFFLGVAGVGLKLEKKKGF